MEIKIGNGTITLTDWYQSLSAVWSRDVEGKWQFDDIGTLQGYDVFLQHTDHYNITFSGDLFYPLSDICPPDKMFDTLVEAQKYADMLVVKALGLKAFW